MKYLIITIILLFSISCKAQIVSLETAAQCYNDPDNCPEYNYEKDINDTLDKYIGTWKGVYDGKTYEIQFKKSLYQDLTLSDLKRDRIKGRLRIKDVNGNVIYNTINEPDDEKTHFNGLGLSSNLHHYMMFFSGPLTSGCINYGTVYLTIKPATPNILNIFFTGEYDIVEGECPITFKTTIPEKQNIYLTKQ